MFEIKYRFKHFIKLAYWNLDYYKTTHCSTIISSGAI